MNVDNDELLYSSLKAAWEVSPAVVYLGSSSSSSSSSDEEEEERRIKTAWITGFLTDTEQPNVRTVLSYTETPQLAWKAVDLLLETLRARGISVAQHNHERVVLANGRIIDFVVMEDRRGTWADRIIMSHYNNASRNSPERFFEHVIPMLEITNAKIVIYDTTSPERGGSGGVFCTDVLEWLTS